MTETNRFGYNAYMKAKARIVGQHPLIAYRVTRGLSWNGLAAELGVSRMAVYRWVKGARQIDTDLLPSIVRKTGIPARRLRPDLAELMDAAE